MMSSKWNNLVSHLKFKAIRKYKLWLVDDEERWHTYFKETYGNDVRFAVECFRSANEVLQEIEKGRKPDLILVDIFFTKDKKELENHNMENELDRIIEEIDRVWQKYQVLYSGDGLELAEHLLDQNVPFCLYTRKGCALIRSEEIGERIIRILRRTDLISKSLDHRIAERMQILRYIDEARAMKERKLYPLKSFAGMVISAILSMIITVNWANIGAVLRKLLFIIFPK